MKKQMYKVKISKATKKEIKAFDKKAWRDANFEHYGKHVIKWVKKDFIFKATQKGKIVGTIKGKFEAGVLYITALIVAREARGHGIGRKLIEKAMAFGKSLKAHKVYLLTMEEWEASKFYKKLGFKKGVKFPKHWLKRDFVVYSKFI